jgi:hypothetical protein
MLALRMSMELPELLEVRIKTLPSPSGDRVMSPLEKAVVVNEIASPSILKVPVFAIIAGLAAASTKVPSLLITGVTLVSVRVS